jgi:hypothetical protein
MDEAMNSWAEESARREAEKIKKLEWLRSLRPGHKVAVRQSRGTTYDIYEVDRITPTQIVVKFNGRLDYRYNKKNGDRIGGGRGGFNFPGGIEPVTNEIIEANEERALRHWFDTVGENNKGLDLTTLRALKAAIEPILAAAKEPEHA